MIDFLQGYLIGAQFEASDDDSFPTKQSFLQFTH